MLDCGESGDGKDPLYFPLYFPLYYALHTQIVPYSLSKCLEQQHFKCSSTLLFGVTFHVPVDITTKNFS